VTAENATAATNACEGLRPAQVEIFVALIFDHVTRVPSPGPAPPLGEAAAKGEVGLIAVRAHHPI